jgi:hypothetical protein
VLEGRDRAVRALDANAVAALVVLEPGRVAQRVDLAGLLQRLSVDEDADRAVEEAILAELGLSSLPADEDADGVRPGRGSQPHPMLERGRDDRPCLSGRALCGRTVRCGRACGMPFLYRGCCCPRGMMDLDTYCAPRLWPLN